MAKIKTTETLKSVDKFINAVADETKRNDSFRIIELIKNQIGFEPKMWGPSIEASEVIIINMTAATKVICLLQLFHQGQPQLYFTFVDTLKREMNY